ncbi:MAG: penicillin-binding protein 2 [Solirubrobacterales bacterium]
MYLRRPETEPPPRSSPLAIRITILTGLAIAIFAVIFLRLWYLQVLSGDRYLDQANDNRVREVRVQAPRGNILDRDGKVLVVNRNQLALQVEPRELPKRGPERKAEMGRLADVTGMRPGEIEQEIESVRKEAPNSPVILREGLGMDAVFYLRENQERFPGVSVERIFRRDYKQGDIAEHLFGNVGEVTAEQLDQPRYAGLKQGDLVGQSGIEYEYDRFLRGKPGTERVQVDALGRPSRQLVGKPARSGDNVRLTIDADLQAQAEGALSSFGLPGAFAVLNVNDGDVLALGSSPGFDPAIYSEPITERQYRELTSRENDAPLANRAIQGLYPSGSVFKPITALAALDEELITPNETYYDDGVFKIDVLTLRNADDAVYGPINMSDAFKFSSDVYFYELGLQADEPKGRGGPIQDWAGDLGLAEPTGIDLPAEAEGLIPSPAWRNRLYKQGLTDRPWAAGDNINLAVGQGDLQVNPLQMAIAYAAIANGGRVLRPHLADQVETVTGEVLEEIRPAPKRQLELPDGAETIMNGLTRAAMEQGGTSYPVFGNFPVQVAGKTGTAERGIGRADQSWYVAVAPADKPEIAVAVTIERAGFGVDAAAPVAARILEKYFKRGITPAIALSEQPGTVRE